jgi:hypothetical protein
MKAVLGGKGANLAEMANAGLPVPPGFTMSTEACAYFSKHGGQYPAGMWDQVKTQLGQLEKMMGKKLGDADNPLLVSVRSGAAVSMPGMMDTVLNLGLTDKSVLGFIKATGNERTGWDCYRRFIDMFGDVVIGCHHDYFEEVLHAAKVKAGVELDNQLTAEQLKAVQEIVNKACAAKIERDRRRGILCRPVRAMIVGVPNVGKSTFINTFVGKASTKTGNKPGVTKGKQWIRLSKDIELLDTPGILWPKFEDQAVGLRLALIGTINDNILCCYP